MTAKAKRRIKASNDASEKISVPRLALERLPIVSLRPCSRNARTHSKKQIRQIAESIRTFGFNNPVLIDKNDQIVAGHGRVSRPDFWGLKAFPPFALST